MASYQKILLCYDGSREGRKALRCGADLALDLKAETHVLSVVDMRSSIAQSAGLLTDVACGSFEKTRLATSCRKGWTGSRERGVTAQGHFAFGHPIDEIANLAKELNVDLVVVGHRCRTGLRAGGWAQATRRCSTGCRAAFWWPFARLEQQRSCRGRGVCGEPVKTESARSERRADSRPRCTENAAYLADRSRPKSARALRACTDGLRAGQSTFFATPSPVQVDRH